jgi:transcriptional regulator with XRE-family HTH domain
MLNTIALTLGGLNDDEDKRKRAFGRRVHELRRQRKLSRYQLELRSGVPQRTILDIENAAKAVLDRKTVILLARAFGLAGIDLREFISVAGLVPDHPLDGRVLEGKPDEKLGLERMMRQFYAEAQLPAYSTNALMDLQSCNSYVLALLGLDLALLERTAYEGAGPNVLRFLFDPAFNARQFWGHDWCKIAQWNLRLFRQASMPHLHKPRYAQLMRALQQLPGFEAMWQSSSPESSEPSNSPVAIHEMPPSFTTAMTAKTAFGLARIMRTEIVWDEIIHHQLRVVLYVPLDHPTNEVFGLVRQQTVKSAIQFGSVEVARFSRIF